MQVTLHPIFDDVTLCKHVLTEENAFRVFISFSYTKKKKQVFLAINKCIVQIVITSSPSGAEFYVMRWVKYGRW